MTEIADQLSCQELVELVTAYLDDALPSRGTRSLRGAHHRLRRLHRLPRADQAHDRVHRPARSRAARPRRGGGAPRRLPRLEAQSVVSSPCAASIRTSRVGVAVPASCWAALALPVSARGSRPALPCAEMRLGALVALALLLPAFAGGADRELAARRPASSGSRRGRRRGRPGSDLHHRRVHEWRRELDQRPGVQSPHEQLEPGGRPAASGRPHDGSRLPRPGLRRGRLRAGPGTPDDALRIHR